MLELSEPASAPKFSIDCFLEFKLVAKKKECIGSETEQGYLKTIKLCQDACEGTASMFIYGLAPERCNDTGCSCYCETSSENGECEMESSSIYNLYSYNVDTKCKIIIIIIFFVTCKTFLVSITRIDRV